jgi:hypothetical protein
VAHDCSKPRTSVRRKTAPSRAEDHWLLWDQVVDQEQVRMRRRGSQHPDRRIGCNHRDRSLLRRRNLCQRHRHLRDLRRPSAGRRRGGRISLTRPTARRSTRRGRRPVRRSSSGTAATLPRRQRDCDFRASRSPQCRVARHVAPRPSGRAIAFRHSGCAARPSARSAAAHVTGARGSASSAAPGWAATRGLLFVAATPARSSTQELKQRSNPRQNEHGPARARQAMSFKSRGVAAVRFATPARSPSMQTPTRASS